MGRPTKLTPATTNRIVKAVKKGLTYKLAAAYGGISIGCFNSWMAQGRAATKGIYKNFFDAVTKANADGAMASMDRIEKSAQKGNWTAAAWTLERRHGYTINRGEERANAEEAADHDNNQEDEVLDRAALIEELRSLPADLLAEALAGPKPE